MLGWVGLTACEWHHWLQIGQTVGLAKLLDVFWTQNVSEIELLSQTAANSVEFSLLQQNFLLIFRDLLHLGDQLLYCRIFAAIVWILNSIEALRVSAQIASHRSASRSFLVKFGLYSLGDSSLVFFKLLNPFRQRNWALVVRPFQTRCTFQHLRLGLYCLIRLLSLSAWMLLLWVL